MSKLDKLTIKGFKSIRELALTLDLGVNILIGANGAGKSNFVEFFRVLRAMVDRRLQAHVLKNGPADGYFHHGIQVTKTIDATLTFGGNRYAFSLEPAADGRMNILWEELRKAEDNSTKQNIYVAAFEAKENFISTMPNWQVYHFHDTSMTAGMRRDVGVDQCGQLLPDASNLAAFLLNWENTDADSYGLLVKTIRRIAPYFDDFEFKVKAGGTEDTVRLTWRQKGSSYLFQPGHFSDGTIRFICLAATLLQPTPPTTIVFDEPELGLHPYALGLLGGLMRSAASRMQLVVSTQSPVLLNEFQPHQIITVNQRDGQSVFERLDAKALEQWLTDYSTGDLWQKGVINGGVNP